MSLIIIHDLSFYMISHLTSLIFYYSTNFAYHLVRLYTSFCFSLVASMDLESLSSCTNSFCSPNTFNSHFCLYQWYPSPLPKFWWYLGNSYVRHSAPTSRPSSSPSFAPTASPTAVPTASPTAVPTASPTSKPTASPTAVPTASPTHSPTSSPSYVRRPSS